MNGSISGQVLRKGKSIRVDSFEQVREDPETLGNPEGRVIYQRLMDGRPEAWGAISRSKAVIAWLAF